MSHKCQKQIFVWMWLWIFSLNQEPLIEHFWTQKDADNEESNKKKLLLHYKKEWIFDIEKVPMKPINDSKPNITVLPWEILMANA